MTQLPQTPTDDELRMSLFEHLAELRNRLVKAFIGLLIGVLIGVFFTESTFRLLLTPYCAAVEGDCQLVVLSPTESVLAYLRVTLMLGAMFAIPFATYQLMMFIIPGLTRRERRMVLSAIPAITLLFLVGVAFAWFILTPAALGFLATFQSEFFETAWTADLYLSFVTALLFWMGVAFQTPLIFFVLSLLGLVRARLLIQQWRLAVVVSAVAAALITPTIDPVNMALVMVPLLVLYVFSIVLVSFGSRRALIKPVDTVNAPG